MIKAIIFDFDGVIFDSEPVHWQAFNTVLEPLGFQIPYDEYLYKYVGLSDKEMFPKILTDYGLSGRIDIATLIQHKIQAYEKILMTAKNLNCIEGLIPFLNASQAFISHFAICSGSTRKELEAALAALKGGALRSYFEFILSSEDVAQGKPSPEGYLKTARQLKVDPQECLVIEDTRNGIRAAKNAKMKVIGLATTIEAEKLLEADYVVTTFDQINLSRFLPKVLI